MGYELVTIIGRTAATHQSVVLSALVVATLVVVRGVWVFGSSAVAVRRARRRDVPWPSDRCRQRLPRPRPDRGGRPHRRPDHAGAPRPHPGPLTSVLGVGRQDDDSREIAELRRRAAQAALDHLRGPGLDGVRAEVTLATLQYEGYLSAQEAIEHARRTEAEDSDEMREELSSVLRQATDVERFLVLAARRGGRVSPASADEVLRDIEGRVLRDFS